jgi:hypothetical protein
VDGGRGASLAPVHHVFVVFQVHIVESIAFLAMAEGSGGSLSVAAILPHAAAAAAALECFSFFFELPLWPQIAESAATASIFGARAFAELLLHGAWAILLLIVLLFEETFHVGLGLGVSVGDGGGEKMGVRLNSAV